MINNATEPPCVRTVAEQHGGSVSVSVASDATRTTFVLAVPLDRI